MKRMIDTPELRGCHTGWMPLTGIQLPCGGWGKTLVQCTRDVVQMAKCAMMVPKIATFVDQKTGNRLICRRNNFAALAKWVQRRFARAGQKPARFVIRAHERAPHKPRSGRFRPSPTASCRESILIVDFGSQVTQLIARRVREAGVYSEIRGPLPRPRKPFARPQSPGGSILSGSPASGA